MVIIGDEILNGFTKEVNMHVASEKLGKGYDVRVTM
jgi:molybdopterin-biosynthesis enzyme MoeA-like protein